jgi:hypothetical protein
MAVPLSTDVIGWTADVLRLSKGPERRGLFSGDEP